MENDNTRLSDSRGYNYTKNYSSPSANKKDFEKTRSNGKKSVNIPLIMLSLLGIYVFIIICLGVFFVWLEYTNSAQRLDDEFESYYEPCDSSFSTIPPPPPMPDVIELLE
ncbi:MAG: hypothetical protein KBT20_11700 [Bacteroidales bacterium]|nr:hypothetical protein [Candidatus Liminaster caballi]